MVEQISYHINGTSEGFFSAAHCDAEPECVALNYGLSDGYCFIKNATQITVLDNSYTAWLALDFHPDNCTNAPTGSLSASMDNKVPVRPSSRLLHYHF